VPICGAPPTGAQGAPAKATLALADQDPETVSGAAYGRKTGERMMTLVYTATGCHLAEDLPVPLDPPPIGPPKDDTVDPIPYGAVRLDGKPEIDGDQYIVHLKVSTSPASFKDQDGKTVQPSFAPGSYAGFLHLRATWLHRVGTPVAISRSDDQWLKVMLLAVLGALGGFGVFVLLHWFAQAELVSGAWRLAIAGLFSVLVGAGVAYTTNYLNQSVWTLGANGRALLVAAFTAATTGPLVTGLLGKVYDDNKAVTGPVRAAKKHAMDQVNADATAKARADAAAAHKAGGEPAP
jgi:hypothetical protein